MAYDAIKTRRESESAGRTRNQSRSQAADKTIITDISALTQHVPYSLMKACKASGCEPLSVDTIPVKRSLTTWWSRWEAALAACNPQLPGSMTGAHLRHFAKFMLGDPCYHILNWTSMPRPVRPRPPARSPRAATSTPPASAAPPCPCPGTPRWDFPCSDF